MTLQAAACPSGRRNTSQIRPRVHIGMAKAASTFVRRDVFPFLPGIANLGKHGAGPEMIAALAAITCRSSLSCPWRGPALTAPPQAAARNAVAAGLRPVLSEEDLSVWKFPDPQMMADRMCDLTGCDLAASGLHHSPTPASPGLAGAARGGSG